MTMYAVESSMRMVDITVIQLRGLGFSASSEFDRETATIILRTNATIKQVERATISVFGSHNMTKID